jgi:hypothetical protein
MSFEKWLSVDNFSAATADWTFEMPVETLEARGGRVNGGSTTEGFGMHEENTGKQLTTLSMV